MSSCIASSWLKAYEAVHTYKPREFTCNQCVVRLRSHSVRCAVLLVVLNLQSPLRVIGELKGASRVNFRKLYTCAVGGKLRWLRFHGNDYCGSCHCC
eukprot:1718270-Amphidinium_carterae.1